MAVKKVKETPEVEVQEEVLVETPVEKVVEDIETEDTTPVVEVEVTPIKEENSVTVDTSAVKPAKKPNGTAKICMRVDHKCTIAMERYDLKAGKVYIVPENVKRILNNAGLLAPLP